MLLQGLELKRAIDELVAERLINSSKTVRKKLPKNLKSGNYFSLLYKDGAVLVYVLLGKDIEPEVRARVKAGQPPIPGLITTDPGTPAAIRLENGYLNQLSESTFTAIHAVSVGSKTNAQLTGITIDLNNVEGVNQKYIVDLCFIISPEKNKHVFDPLEQVSDLLVQYTSFISAHKKSVSSGDANV